MRKAVLAFAFVTTLAVSTLLTVGGRSSSQTAEANEAALLEARAGSNEAIRTHDADRVASFWAEDYSLVSSTNQHVTGREANRTNMARHFVERPDVLYVRTAKELGFYAPWEMAYEIGEWEGGWTEPEGGVTIGGTYLAKWQKTGDRWLIQAEIFVPTHCEGTSYCEAR